MNGVIAMIPARLGSQRVPRKNLRLLGEKPLIAYVIETAKALGAFEAVYVNSEALVFERLARDYGVRFYHRPAVLASDAATNDQFAVDFMNAVSCDVLVQLNPTSPFVTTEDLRRALAMVEEGYETVLAVKEVRIEAVFQGRPVNFSPRHPMPPSQELEPIYAFCNGILAWRTTAFRRNIERYGSAVYGGDGRTGYCALQGKSTLDIDTEADFQLAEAWLACAGESGRSPTYWGESGASGGVAASRAGVGVR